MFEFMGFLNHFDSKITSSYKPSLGKYSTAKQGVKQLNTLVRKERKRGYE